MQTNIDITRAFMETPDGVLSIHQISRKLKLPYGTAYNRIHLLHNSGIVQILPQGKAKLCALNSDNPMTATLMALGSAQITDRFLRENPEAGLLLKKIRKTLAESSSNLATAILLTPDNLKILAAPAPEEPPAIDASAEDLSLDFFFIKTSENFDETATETAVTALLPPGLPARVTSMTVDRDTLLGMLTESENEAGLAAYSMLHEGMILLGFENFYTLILEAFSRKIAS